MSTKAELACVYASLILVDDDVAVTVSPNSYDFLLESLIFKNRRKCSIFLNDLRDPQKG